MKQKLRLALFVAAVASGIWLSSGFSHSVQAQDVLVVPQPLIKRQQDAQTSDQSEKTLPSSVLLPVIQDQSASASGANHITHTNNQTFFVNTTSSRNTDKSAGDYSLDAYPKNISVRSTSSPDLKGVHDNKLDLETSKANENLNNSLKTNNTVFNDLKNSLTLAVAPIYKPTKTNAINVAKDNVVVTLAHDTNQASKKLSKLPFPTFFKTIQAPPPLPYLHSENEIHNRKHLPVVKISKLTTKTPDLPTSTSEAFANFQLSALGVSVQEPEIPELARALNYNPDLIYEYVYNTIETLPQYGSLKGAVGALLDGQGTSFDQAELMYRLLQASGYAPSYRFGQINLTVSQMMSWLGTDNTLAAVSVTLGSGGFPGTTYSSANNLGIAVSADIGWAWISVPINGINYVFNPSHKNYIRSTGLSNLASSIGYNQATFLARAKQGTAQTATTIAGLNRANIRADLSTYATNFVNYIKLNSPTATTANIISGVEIQSLPPATALRQSALANQVGVITSSANIPDAYRTTLSISLPGASGSPFIFNSSDIYGHRLGLFFNNINQPVLTLDGSAIPGGTGGVPTGSPASIALGIKISHPFAATTINPACGATPVSFADDCNTLNIEANGSYIISNGWGPVGRGMIEKHRKLLAQNTSAQTSVNPAAESVLGQSLAMLGYTWLAETSEAQKLATRISKVNTVWHHSVGIAGMSALSGSQSPYVDLPVNFVSIYALNAAQNNNVALQTANITTGIVSSVLESGSIEQSQPGIDAISTTKLLDIALQSDTVFDLDNTSGNNYGYYSGTVRPQLVPTWSASSLAQLDYLMSYGFRAIVPKNGMAILNQWKGTGLFYFSAGFPSSIGATITRGLSGGIGTKANPPEQFNVNAAKTMGVGSQSNVNTGIGVTAGGLSAVSRLVGDPVNVVTGDFIYRHNDLTVGSGDFPYGLTIQRSYDSGQRFKSSPLGLGWTHNYAITALPDSTGFTGIGQSSPISAANAIITIYVMNDIMGQQNVGAAIPLDRLAIAIASGRWLVDQLTNNSVIVTQPGNNEQFIKMADGSYMPPLGSASQLALNTINNNYTYTTKDKQILTFNNAGNIVSWRWPNGPVVSFNYDIANKLTSVSNGMGRALNFVYNGGQLTQANDGNGRTLNYGFDAAKNLSSYTDAVGSVTAFSYVQSGQLSNIFYPSRPTNAFVTNIYDALGRIKSQAEANGNITNFYFAGSRTQVNNPLGASHVYYFNPRGKILSERDELNNISYSIYDNLDRLTKVSLPEGNSLNYVYDSNHNVISVVAQPKAGSGLANATQSFTYHPTYNKVTAATEANGRTTIYTCDAPNGNLLAINQPAVGGIIPRQTFSYNQRGQLTNTTDAKGKTTNLFYNAGNEALLAVTDDV